MSQRNGAQHYLVLDAARGIAAVMVFFYHLKRQVFFNTPVESFLYFSKSYLAVDLFFLMSGLVIAKSYSDKLGGGMSFKEFMIVRFLRLYPLYFLGLVLGGGYLLFKYFLNAGGAIGLSDLGRSFLYNIFFLPDFLNSNGMFTLDPPAWSLSLEWLINILYAIFAVKLSLRQLLSVVGVAAIGLIIFSLSFGTVDLGMMLNDYLGGWLRILFSFTLGLVIYRLVVSDVKIPSIHPVVLVFIPFFVLFNPLKLQSVCYDLVCVFIVFPIFVWLGCGAKVSNVLAKPFSILGQASYGLYILHAVLISWLAGIWQFLMKAEPNLFPLSSLIVISGAVFVLSYLATVWFDEPVRAFLKKRIVRA